MYFKRLFKPYMDLPKEIYIIFISKLINALGCFVMPLLTLILTDKIGLSKQDAGFYLSISGLLFLPASIIGGKLADVFERKIVIVVFDFLAAVLYIITGFIKPSMTMIYMIMLSGACMTAAAPGHDSLVADMTTPKNRKGAYSLLYMGWNMGFAIGPIIGGILYKDHLPLVFVGDAATALIALSLIIIFVKETIKSTENDIKDMTRINEKREKGSVISVILKRPILIYVALILFGYNFVYSQWSFMLPMQIMNVYKSIGARYFGMVASLNGMVVMIFTPLLTKITDGKSDLRRMVYGGIFYTIGFGMLGFVSTMPFFLLSAFIFTLGEIVLAISISPFIANRTPASHRGRMSAVIPMIFGAGYTFGPLGMGIVLKYIDIKSGWIMLGIFVFIATFMMYSLERYDSKKQIKYNASKTGLEGN